MAIDIVQMFGANIFLTLILLAATAIPLYFAVRFMGGDVTFMEAMLVIVIAGGIPMVMGLFFNAYLKLLSFIAIIAVYMFFFKLNIWKALITWLVQYAMIFVLLYVFSKVPALF